MRISYSTLHQYELCPRRWKLLQTHPFESNEDTEVGVIVHKALEIMLREGIPHKEALLKAYSGQNWVIFNRACNLLEKFDLPPHNIKALEESFELDLGRHVLVGVIDRVDDYDGQEIITDYKTSSYIPPKEELENELQPAIYMLARPGAMFRYYYIAHNLQIPINKTEDDLELAKAFIITLADFMERDDVCLPKLNKWCPFCQFRYDCSLFQNSHLNIEDGDLIEKWEKTKQIRRFMELQEEELKSQILARIAEEGNIEHNGKTYYAEPRKRREFDFGKILPILQERNLLNACYVKLSELPRDPQLWEALSEAERINYLGMEIKER